MDLDGAKATLSRALTVAKGCRDRDLGFHLGFSSDRDTALKKVTAALAQVGEFYDALEAAQEIEGECNRIEAIS